MFLGFRSPNRRESPAEGFSLFAIRVNVPDLCLVSWRALRALRLLRGFGEQSRPRSYFERTLKPTIIQGLCTQGEPILALKATTVFKSAAQHHPKGNEAVPLSPLPLDRDLDRL